MLQGESSSFGHSIARGLFIIQLSPRGNFCKSFSAICSREAACFLVISKKNHQYIMGREERSALIILNVERDM